MSVEVGFYRYGKFDAYTIVDDDVAEMVGARRLTSQGGYVFLGARQLHRLVMGCVPKDGLVVHHINEDRTDNRRSNLKICEGLMDHGNEPHPWRNRLCGLAPRIGWERAERIVAQERADAGLRPIGGVR